MRTNLKASETAERIEVQKLVGGEFTPGQANVVIERELPIFVNGQHLVTASLSPIMVKEFVAGYLFSQGFIDNYGDIESIRFEKNTANVSLSSDAKIARRKDNASLRIVSGGGKAVYFEKAALPEIKSRTTVGKEVIYRAMNTLFERAEIYRDTEGGHAAGLYKTDGTPVIIAEDIGRHNTLDKVIGYALMNRINVSNALLATTGRMTSEMVAKICRAKIPVAATKTAVTSTAIKIAAKSGLTLIGFVRDTGNRINTDMEVRVIEKAGMKIYTHPGRIT
jgi:FdhD protein